MQSRGGTLVHVLHQAARQRFALLGKAEGLANQDKTAHQRSIDLEKTSRSMLQYKTAVTHQTVICHICRSLDLPDRHRVPILHYFWAKSKTDKPDTR